MGTEMAGVAIAELGVEIATLMAVQTDGHGTDHLPTHRIKAVPHPTVAIAAGYILHLAMHSGIVRGTQPVLRDIIG